MTVLQAAPTGDQGDTVGCARSLGSGSSELGDDET